MIVETRISHEIHFPGRRKHFLWQAQHFVNFWEIAGSPNAVFSIPKATARWDRQALRSDGCEMTISSSNRLCIGGCKSEVFRRNLELRISWQAQYLVKLAGDSCCSARCTGRCIRDKDQS